MKPSGVISIITDFGDQDHFVGTMKGVILSVNPNAKLVDITHQIPPQNVFKAAMQLYKSYSFFPEGTVHMAVVDPGVGTDRKILAARTNRHIFLAPDNGLLYPILEEEENVELFSVTRKYALSEVSQTFHGRDIFAPVAAWLSLGIRLSEVGTPCQKFEVLEDFAPARYSHKITGKVVLIDRFGNLITNIPSEWFIGRNFEICLRDLKISKLSQNYSDSSQDPIALTGSDKRLEIAINGQSAAQALGVDTGQDIVISFRD